MSYKLTHEYDAILEDLLKNQLGLEYIAYNGVAVGIIASDKEKKKEGGTVYADCRKAPEYWKTFTPYDFLITIYEPNCEGKDDEHMRRLLHHELLHIGVDGERLFCKPHDLQDFKVIVDKYGVDWIE